MVFVILHGECRERVSAVLVENPFDVLGRRFHAAAQDDGPQEQDQKIEAGQPSCYLKRAQKAGGVRSHWVHTRVTNQDSGAERFTRGTRGRMPRELSRLVAQTDTRKAT